MVSTFLRRSFLNLIDKDEDEATTQEKRISSATSVSSSQDEGIHSTGEKEEDDINDEDLLENKLPEGNQNKADDTEEDEGRGSFLGGKFTDDESDEEARVAGNESDEETIKNEESEVDIDGTEDKESDEEAPDEEAAADESEPPDYESEKPLESDDAASYEPVTEEPETKEEEEEQSEFEEAAIEDQSEEDEPGVDDQTEVDEQAVEDQSEVDELYLEAQEREEVTAFEEEEEEPAVEEESEIGELQAFEEPLDAIEEATEENDEVSVQEPEPPPIESEGEKSVAEDPAIANIPGTIRKKREVVDLSKVSANRKPLYMRAALPISSKKENTNFKPQIKSKTDIHRQQNYRLKRKPPNITVNKENKENELPPLRHSFGKKESADEVNSSGNAGRSAFLNPHMDHSLKRPTAPHYRLKTSEINKSPRLSLRGQKGTEVYVPEEEKIYVYSYSSIPRVLHSKRMTQRKYSTQFTNDIDPNTSVRLKFRNARLIRGSTFGKDGMPQWDPYFAYARCLSRNDFQNLLEAPENTLSNFTSPRYNRKSRSSISVATQVNEGERSSQLTARSPEASLIKNLVANTIREATMEVAAEAEEEKAQREIFEASRLSILEEGSPAVDAAPDETEPMEDDAKEDEEVAGEEDNVDEAATVENVGGEEEAEEDTGGGEEAEPEAEETNEEEAYAGYEEEAEAEAEAENADDEVEGDTEEPAEETAEDEEEGDAEEEAENDENEEAAEEAENEDGEADENDADEDENPKTTEKDEEDT